MTSSKQLIDLKPGDIVGFSGHNLDSYLINLATYGLPRWGISHVGIVSEYRNELLIFESTTEAPAPCVIQGAYVQGTQAHRIATHLHHYRGKMWYYPLVKPLRWSEGKRLTAFLMRTLGRPYDLSGARHAAGKLWSYLLRDNALDALYCSEWVVAAHRHIERFDTPWSNWSPNALIREERRRGIIATPWRIK
jgi:hypothetical protein